MGVLPTEYVKTVADATGSPDLPDSVAQLLASDLEYRLHEVAQEAAKFMRHGKRRRLTTDDVNQALRSRNMAPVLGYGTSKADFKFRKAPDSDVHFIPDENVSLRKVVAEKLPTAPVEMSFSTHWLAIEGRQPLVPQNPSATVIERPADGAAEAADAEAAAAGTRTGPPVEIAPLVRHVLSREQQLLLTKLTAGVIGEDAALREAALGGVAQDPGLHQLVPYFVEFVQERIRENLKSVVILQRIIGFVAHLLKNPDIFLEPYLHQIMPSILTCVVAKRLHTHASDNHWAVREAAACVVATICSRYSSEYQKLQTRVTRTMVDAMMDPSRPLTTHYGAIACIAALGVHAIDTLIIDNVKAFMAIVDKKSAGARGATEEAARRVRNRLLQAVGEFCKFRAAQMSRGAAPPQGALALSEGDEKRMQALRVVFGAELDAFAAEVDANPVGKTAAAAAAGAE